MALDALIAREFHLDPALIHLNHAAIGPWPQRTVAAVEAFAAENGRMSSSRFPDWLRTTRDLRAGLCRLIGAAAPDDIALVTNTSEGLSIVAHGLSWSAGENVVITNLEFISNRIAWESLARYGVECRVADITGPDPEGAIEALFDRHTRLLSVSSVQYGRGLRMDLARLSAACRKRGIVFCVDAIQSLGALAHDCEAEGIDILVAGGHKWLLSPEGMGLFYCRPEIRDRLDLHRFGWHMVEHAGDFERADWAPAAGARRFEAGSPNRLGIMALQASVSLFLEAGPAAIEARVLANADTLREGLAGRPDIEILSPSAPARRSGIVTFAVAGCPATALANWLGANGVLCAARGGGVRFAPHFHNRADSLERALALLDDAAAACRGQA